MYLFYYLPIFVRNKYKRKKTHQLHTNIQSQTQYFVKQNCDKNYDNFVPKKNTTDRYRNLLAEQ